MDRDERRIEALKRLFRDAFCGPRSVDRAAMKRIGAALRDESPRD